MYAADGIALFQNSKDDSLILACLKLYSAPFLNFDTSTNLGSAESVVQIARPFASQPLPMLGLTQNWKPFMSPGFWVRGIFRYRQSSKIRNELG